MKKLSKKEVREMEELTKERLRIREEMMEALENYWNDISAVIRVAKLTHDTAKLTSNGDLMEIEQQKLFKNYKVLQGLTKSQLRIIKTLINNKRDEKQEELPEDAIWIKDQWYDEDELMEQVELFKRIEINKIYLTERSTAVISLLVWYTKIGAKVIGTTNISEYNEGLIIEL